MSIAFSSNRLTLLQSKSHHCTKWKLLCASIHFTYPIIRSTLKATVILLPLLGLTWVFGVLAIDTNTTVFAWLFTICNSTQVCNAPGWWLYMFHMKLAMSKLLIISYTKLQMQYSILFTYTSRGVWFILHAKSLPKYYHCREFWFCSFMWSEVRWCGVKLANGSPPYVTEHLALFWDHRSLKWWVEVFHFQNLEWIQST